MAELMKLVGPANRFMRAFSDHKGQDVKAAQRRTPIGLEQLRTTAKFAATRARLMRETAKEMRRELRPWDPGATFWMVASSALRS